MHLAINNNSKALLSETFLGFIERINTNKVFLQFIDTPHPNSSGPIPRFWNFHRILKPLEFTQILHKKSAYISKLGGSQNSRIIRI